MEKAFEELKSLIGLNKLLILVATALMALFIDNHEYKSLSESLVNLKTKELSTVKTLLLNIEISKAIIFLIVSSISIITHGLIKRFLAKAASRNTSLAISIENIVKNYHFDEASDLAKRIQAQNYTEVKFIKEISKINHILKVSEIFYCIGFFLVFASFYCGFLDFIIGFSLMLFSFFLLIKHQIEILKITPKYIASDIILNNSQIEKAINNYLNI